MVSNGFPVETNWVLTFARSTAQLSVSHVTFADFLILGIVAVDIRTHDLENLLCNAVKPTRHLSVEIIPSKSFT